MKSKLSTNMYLTYIIILKDVKVGVNEVYLNIAKLFKIYEISHLLYIDKNLLVTVWKQNTGYIYLKSWNKKTTTKYQISLVIDQRNNESCFGVLGDLCNRGAVKSIRAWRRIMHRLHDIQTVYLNAVFTC